MGFLTSNCFLQQGPSHTLEVLTPAIMKLKFTHKIESVHRYFTKRLFGLSKLSYCERLISLDLDTLERRRLIYDLVFCYKMVHGLCDIYQFCLLTMHTGTHVVIVLNLINSSVLLMLGRTFFSSRVIDAWNSLSNDVVKSTTQCKLR